jgi:hypothetical protein
MLRSIFEPRNPFEAGIAMSQYIGKLLCCNDLQIGILLETRCSPDSQQLVNRGWR